MGSKISKASRQNHISQCLPPPAYEPNEHIDSSNSSKVQVVESHGTKTLSDNTKADVLQMPTFDIGFAKSHRHIPSTGIKASDPPQWLWSNEECREWAFAILVGFYKEESSVSRVIANKYDSFGLGLWRLSVGAWKCWFGDEGEAMFDYMVLMYHQRTSLSLPLTCGYPHLERRPAGA